MKAWQVVQIGQDAQLLDVPEPRLPAGHVMVSVTAVGLNFADMLMQAGRYQEKPPLPYTPGMEVAGRVVALGAGANQFTLGQRVAGFAGAGGLAERIALPEARLLALPDAVPDSVGAGFQIAYGTSHLALAHKAKLRAGETVLVLGAAGGVGLTAVEIAKKMGARVIASARGAARLEIARAAGADVLIDSETPDLKAAFKAAGGVDVVYDAVGGPAFMAALSATRPEGRLLTIGFAGGEVPQIPANILLVKNISVMGLYWGGYLTFAPQVLKDSLAEVLGWLAAGALHAHISHSLPFARYPEALALLRDRKATGKVLVTLP